MSTYYTFYLGRRGKKTHEVEIIGNYVKIGDEYFDVPIHEVSASFIDGESFVERGEPIRLERFKDYFEVSWLTEGAITELMATRPFLVQGYLPYDDITHITKHGYDYWDDIEFIPAETFAEKTNRKGYGHAAALDKHSAGYHAMFLMNALDSIYASRIGENWESGIVMTVG